MKKSLNYPLFKPNEYHEACGTGFIATLNKKPERRVLVNSLGALKRLSHRGAQSFDRKSGDGSGILTDLPKKFFKTILKNEFNYDLNLRKNLAVAMVFTTKYEMKWLTEQFNFYLNELGLDLIAIREVPTDKKYLGEIALKRKPHIVQYFIGCKKNKDYEYETQLYLLRKKIESDIIRRKKKSYICSLSSKIIVYKGLLSAMQIDEFYKDLQHIDFEVKMAIFHERFSTNTGSTWAMAQPFNMIAHNGEFNTIKGNRLWMKARENQISSEFWGKNIDYLKPVISQHGSDSSSFDNLVEFLVRSGQSIYDSLMMLIPDSYHSNRQISSSLRDYFIYNENFMEPWDGPAAIVFTDGDKVGAKMDRNGLRPLRYSITKDGLVVMASESGVLDIDDRNVVIHHHMKSEEIFGLDVNSGEIMKNDDIKKHESSKKKFGSLISKNLHKIGRKSPEKEFGIFRYPSDGFDKRLRIAFGLSNEDVKLFLVPMSESRREPIGSMGDDTPIALVSDIDRKFYDYFKQWFAQVTNPPIDSIRERSVMSLQKYLGSEDNLLNAEPHFKGAIRIESPVLSPNEVLALYSSNNWFPHKVVNCNYNKSTNIENKINLIRQKCKKAVLSGAKIIFLSNEGLGEKQLPIPMPLIVSAVHHFLVEKKMRSSVSLIVISGDIIEDHHIAVLISLGASAVYPYMAYEILREYYYKDSSWPEKMSNYRFALEKGLLKIMAKMGISTISSYTGSMMMHSLGVGYEISKKYFPSIPSIFGGIELKDIHEKLVQRNFKAFQIQNQSLLDIGLFKYRKKGEIHGFSPFVFRSIQKSEEINISNEDKPIYIRDFFSFSSDKMSIDIERVEDLESIISRLGSGGISFGAISDESHRTLAKGFALAGARSNTGEGGELEDRYSSSNPDKFMNSYVKQIASGRFGVTLEYLVAAREIQIKMAQGAKPGEGGQLPGFKVSSLIASARSSNPGLPLISPPPHHDIYSIEDIKQLIYDLKQINTRAKVSVKLVSQPGVGIVASGVVKAGADIVLISGSDGGTGASPLGSLKHAGFPWEYGLSETHQTLTGNGLRDRVILRVDGGFKSGRDVVIAAMLGAEEFDFGTSALVALGCVMARRCHLNNCPAGIATTSSKYTKNFKGQPDDIKKYLGQIASEIQALLSEIGFKDLQSIIGRVDLLDLNKAKSKILKIKKIDLNKILTKNDYRLDSDIKVQYKKSRKKLTLDEKIIEEVRSEILTNGHAVVYKNINNTNRSIGAMLSGEIALIHGSNFKGSIQIRLFGTAGQSFGAFLSKGIELRLKGTANDYVGKGMSSGVITIRMPQLIRRQHKHHTVIGNVALYGSTGGEIYVAGKGGERFAVRNSGASGVIEGIGNHGCEYMTNGTIVILGKIGSNFGAGMTGGVTFVYTKNKSLKRYINNDFIDESELEAKDKNLVIRLIRNHVFHTDSSIGNRVLKNWKNEKNNFKKLSPKALKIVDLDSIYNQKTEDRMSIVLNE